MEEEPTSVPVPVLLSSPLPETGPTTLNHEEEEACDDAVRALAEALAPSILEAEEILQLPLEFRNNGSTDAASKNEDYDDDDLDNEVDALRSSEALLRQELEMAQDFSSLFQFTHLVVNEAEGDNMYNVNDDRETDTENNNITDTEAPSLHHDDAEETGEIPVGVNESLTPIKLKRELTSPKPATPDLTKQTHDDDESFLLEFPSPSLSLRRYRYNPMPYKIHDHQRALSLRKEQHGGWYSVGIGRHFGISIPKRIPTDADNGDTNPMDPNATTDIYDNAIREYCLSIPAPTLQKLFVGLPDRTTSTVSTSIAEDGDATLARQSAPDNDPTNVEFSPMTPPLPIRTITMQIRPDVLCGAVMEVVHRAFLEVHAHVTKRQGGHIQGVFARSQPPITVRHEKSSHDNTTFMIDVRLVTAKSETYDRVLLIRIYHYRNNINHIVSEETHTPLPSTDDVVVDSMAPEISNDILFENNVSLNTALHIREASALIQIMESATDVKRRIIHGASSDVVDLTRDEMRSAVSKHLLEHYRACPSVKNADITLPSLNAEDFEIIQASGGLIQLIWDEIETRDLAYITLRSSRFGSFPSLPTLDVQYCSQLRRISREAMTTQLIKTASELEQYAREAELACANMITLLKPTFAVYGVEAPQLPKPKQLTEYPFDFIPSQISCPPWGVKVQHALNEIQAWTGDANRTDSPDSQIFPTEHSTQYADRSIDMANTAVKLILEAFQKQDDDEQSARLGRKNIQVMDRLAKMQAHELLSIQTIQNCYNISDKAMLAAQSFHTKCGIREVPLVKWTIMVGRSTGTCIITANHILFVTKLIPVLGGSKTDVFNVNDVELITEEVTATILNPLPTVIYVKQNRRTVYTFRPSVGAARLTSFFNVVKGAASRTLFDVSD